MTQTTTIGDFTYCTRVLEAKDTATRYGETAEQLRNNPNAWYAMWMNSRRHSEYSSFAKHQRTELHTIAMHINNQPICTCGLIVKLSGNGNSSVEAQVLSAPGHLNLHQDAIVNCFFTKQKASGAAPWLWHLFCRLCQTSIASSQVASARQKELADFRKDHTICKGEK
jgi:hypothetical protein